jgi:aldose 1-epimerase
MFFVEKEAFGTQEKIVLRHSGGLRAEILPFYGATLNLLHFPSRTGKFYNIIDGYSFEDEPEKSGALYKGVILFPYPNRLRNGTWIWKGKSLEFPINEIARNNQLHGFLFNQPFFVSQTSASNEMASVVLRYIQPDQFPWYPFEFEIELEYILTENEGITIISRVFNKGLEEMPFGLGWHPYFKTGSPVNDLVLKMPRLKMLDVDEQMIPNGSQLPFRQFDTPQTLADTSLDTGFLIENQEIFETQVFDPNTKIKFTVWQEAGNEGYKYLQVYTPPHRQSIAIEPMSCRANALQDMDGGIQLLASGNSQTFSWGIKV